jgi:FkbM family methyltransferase
MGLKTRTELFKAYFSSDRDFPFAMRAVVKGVTKPPCTRIGPRYVESITEEGDYLIVRIRDVGTPLHWPKVLPLFDLYKVTTECFDAEDWHYYEVPQTQVAPGDVVLDCGAAEGMFTLRVLERAGPIVAFEPSPLFAQSLERTFGPSGKVTVVPYALSDREGTAYLGGDSLYGIVSDDGRGVPIQLTTLDAWLATSGLDRVDYIKADLESFELPTLRGAAQTIQKHRPKIAITVYHPGNNWREIVAFAQGLVPAYQYTIKGLSYNSSQARPVMLHLWTP